MKMVRSRSGDNSSESILSRREEGMLQALSAPHVDYATPESAEDDHDETGTSDEDDANNNPSPQKPKPKRDVWLLADACWYRYRLRDLVLVLLFVAYVVVAAMAMVVFEERRQSENRYVYERTLDEYWLNFADNLTGQLLNTSDLVMFVDSDISAKVEAKLRHELFKYREGLLEIYGTRDQRDLEWDFWNATLFGLSLFTTIGYKHLYPITTEGKIATMIFATFGIPLLLTVIQRFALLLYDVLTLILNSVVSFCKRKWTTAMLKKHGHHRPPPLPSGPSPKKQRPRVALPFSIGVFLLLTCIFACPLTILLWEPEWTYFDAFYYFFLSFTTVGLDYGMPSKHQYLYLVWLWAIVGLSLLSLCFKILNTPGGGGRRCSFDPSLHHSHHHHHHQHYMSASMAAQTDSACMPSDWCVSTMSLASSRMIERSIGPSQLVKIGTPKLPRKWMPYHHQCVLAQQRETPNKSAPKRRRFMDRTYDLICDQGSGVFLAKQEEANVMAKSKDALSGVSDEYKPEMRWLSKLGHFSETQSLNEMTMTDSVDEKKFVMEAMRQQQYQKGIWRSGGNAIDERIGGGGGGQVRIAGDSTSSGTPTTTGDSPESR